MRETTEYCTKGDKYKGASEKSIQLNKLYKDYCRDKNILYVDNNELQTGVDGVHLTKESHKMLALKLSDVVREKF